MGMRIVLFTFIFFVSISTTVGSELSDWISRVGKTNPQIATAMDDYRIQLKRECNITMNSDMMAFVVKYDKIFKSMLVYQTNNDYKNYFKILQYIKCPIES